MYANIYQHSHAFPNIQMGNVAVQCLQILVGVKTRMYANLPSKLTVYFEEMIKEQEKKALNRIAWHYVDEIVRPDTLNELFAKEINSMKNLPGLGKNSEGNRNWFMMNLKAYLPIAEARFIDNTVRTVTTHIFDVPRGGRMTRIDMEPLPSHSFHAPQILDDANVKELMQVSDELASVRAEVTARVRELTKLRHALRAMPPAKFSRSFVRSPVKNERIRGDHQSPKASQEPFNEEFSDFSSVRDENSNFSCNSENSFHDSIHAEDEGPTTRRFFKRGRLFRSRRGK